MKTSEGGFLITKIHHLSGRIFSRLLKKHHIRISPGQGRILFALWRDDVLHIKELMNRTQLSKSTLTDMLDRMEKEGLVERVPSEVDKRRILVHMTERTKKLNRRYQDASTEMTELFYRGFSEAEIDEFEDYLRRLLSNLVDYDDT